MKKRSIILVLVLTFVLGLMAGCGTEPAASDTQNSGGTGEILKIGVSGEYYPFCYTENDNLQGFEIDAWNEIGSRLGYTVEFSVSDFTGLLGMLDSGKIDSIGYGVAINADRQEKYLFSDPYLYSDYSVVTVDDSTHNTIEDFIGEKIGVVMGGEGERKLKELCEAETLDIEITGYENTSSMDADVQLGRIAARLAPKIQTSANIAKNDLNLKITDIVIYTETDAYPFPKEEKYEALVEQVNATLKEMRDDGTLSALSEKWFNLDATNP